jgi:hypothetical protein
MASIPLSRETNQAGNDARVGRRGQWTFRRRAAAKGYFGNPRANTIDLNLRAPLSGRDMVVIARRGELCPPLILGAGTAQRICLANGTRTGFQRLLLIERNSVKGGPYLATVFTRYRSGSHNAPVRDDEPAKKGKLVSWAIRINIGIARSKLE